jgi:hypothetical protein
MRPFALRTAVLAAALLWLLLAALTTNAAPNGQGGNSTIPPSPSVLLNGDFECTTGYYSTTNAAGKTIFVPNEWQLVISEGAPKTHSTLLNFTKNCADAGLEHIDGIDSILVEAQDLESPPAPGKPFDVSFHQQVTATVGGAYSLSGWLLSLCGGSNVPSDCPDGYYMAKMLGIDPTGGVDPLADSVVWVENRRNFVEEDRRVGWTNLYTVAVAQAPTITLFARVASPFQWHGNHAFIDALSLVRSPAATLQLPATVSGTAVIVSWNAFQSPDVLEIPGGNYRLYVDVQYRHQDSESWTDWVTGHSGSGSQVFSARCLDTRYEFRIRARAEQPADEAGAWPNQRYPGIWSEGVPVLFDAIDEPVTPGPVENPTFLPLVAAYRAC